MRILEHDLHLFAERAQFPLPGDGQLSADHLEHASEAGVAAMRQAGTVAVLLPGAYYTLRDTQVPPLAAFRRHGVPMAVATDCNPGSSPLTSRCRASSSSTSARRGPVARSSTGPTGRSDGDIAGCFVAMAVRPGLRRPRCWT